MRAFLVVTLLLASTAVHAQRPSAAFEHQKRTAAIEYGAVPLGQHSVSELPVGQTWRLGMNEASVWRLDVPVLAGDKILAPGSYRAQLQRASEDKFHLLANGSELALGGTGDGQVDGVLGKAVKPSKKLVIEWRKKGAAAAGSQPSQLVVQFGEKEWIGDVTVIGHKDVKLGAWKGVVWQLPFERVEAGASPVATLSKGEQNWNVVLEKQSVTLVPWMAAPTEQFGFGEVKGPAADAVVAGKVEPLEMKVEKPWPVVEVLSSKVEKGEVIIDLGFGTTAVRLTLPEPKAKAGK